MNKRLNIYLLVTLALCLFVTKASAYNVVDEIVGFMLDKRQANTTSITTTTSTTTTPSSTSTTTTTPTSSTTTTTSRTTVTSSTTRGSSSSSTRDDDTSTTSLTTLTTATTTRPVTTVTLTVDGKVTTSTGFTSETLTQTAGSRETDRADSDGISTSTRNTIIGVVVGVGGVIMIGALAIVAYRLRKRKTSGAGGGYPEDLGVAGSPSTGASSRPQDAFKATLDQYHKPQGTVNPSANF